MKGRTLFALLAAITLGAILVIGTSMYFTYNNKFTTLKNLYDAQVDKDRLVYDELWKVIKTEAQVSEKYSDSFRKNYQAIMQSRNYGGEMMKWITEANPNFTPELYIRLANTIETQRATFTSNQTTLISIHKELKDLIYKFPSSVFLTNRTLPDLKLVTSTQTEEVFSKAKEDSVKVF